MKAEAELVEELRTMDSGLWPRFVNSRSGLPGPRANLSVVSAVASIATTAAIEALLTDGEEFAVMCAAAALASQATAPQQEQSARLLAADDRWRVREGVAIGLQLLGDRDPDGLSSVVRSWVENPDPLVRRAAVAGICEPRLLRTPETASAAIETCKRATDSISSLPSGQRTTSSVRTLRQALGYCWSVAIAADPPRGLRAFAALDDSDPDVAWIITENRRKKRLAKLLPESA